MAGLISQEGSLFKVTFPFAGKQHEVHSLDSLADAGVVGMALAVRAAEELQQALDAAGPGNQGQPSFRLPTAATLGASRLPPTSFSQLVEQLQACVDWRNKEQAQVAAHYGEEFGKGNEMAPVCGLLAAAASLGFAAVVHVLLQLSPAAASEDWPSEGQGSAAHRAAQQGHVEALRALLAAAPGAALARSSGYKDRGVQHDDWGVMHSAAEGGSLEAVQVLLEAAPALASAVTTRGLTPLHLAAEAGHVPVVQAVLQAAPEEALVADEDSFLPLHWGASHLEVVQLLLAAAPGTALARTVYGTTALHLAALGGAPASAQALLQAAPEAVLVADVNGKLPLHWGASHVEVVQLLLAAAPGTALACSTRSVTALHYATFAGAHASVQALLQAAPEAALVADDCGKLPLHLGARNVELIQLLLAAAPGTALARTADGSTALHFAALEGAPASVQALLQAAPEAALVADDDGFLPLHWGASHVEVVQLLLAAAPDTTFACSAYGRTALHFAAFQGSPAAVQALLQAAPESACVADDDGRTPLQYGLDRPDADGGNAEHLEALRVLVAADPSPATLAAIAERGGSAAPLFADFIAAAPPLTAEQWASVPAPCPRLGRALPAALAHSHEQACQLVRRLPPADAIRLRTFALVLACLQRCLHVALPGNVAGKLLGLCLAD